MAKLNPPRQSAGLRSPVTTTTTRPRTATYEGGAGYERPTRSELPLLAMTHMVSEGTAYESALARDNRFSRLVQTAAQDDLGWLTDMFLWQRTKGGLRDAPVVGAMEALEAYQRPGADQPPQRDGKNLLRTLLAGVQLRADEPAKALLYWAGKHGVDLGAERTRVRAPRVLEKAISDAIYRLWGEYSYLKYDSEMASMRFVNLLRLVHPTSYLDRDADTQVTNTWRGSLYQHIIDEAKGKIRSVDDIPRNLPMVRARYTMMRMSPDERRELMAHPEQARAAFRTAGMTWQNIGTWLPGGWSPAGWEAIIPMLGYDAVLKNLRNFDRFEVSNRVAEEVIAKLVNEEAILGSHLLPMRFLAAHRAVRNSSSRWTWAIERALDTCLKSITKLGGHTLILVDTSSSMEDKLSARSDLQRWDAAAVFGIATGRRCEKADVVSFSSNQMYWGDRPGAKTKQFDLRAGESLLKSIDRWENDGYFLGGGTDTVGAVRRHLQPHHDRVIILTDEQHNDNSTAVSDAVPERLPLYTWNLAGYKPGHGVSGSKKRHTFGGLSDAGYQVIDLIENQQRSGRWPWEEDSWRTNSTR
jgi:hypothetical protein